MVSSASTDGLCSRMASAKLDSASSSLYVSPEDVSYQYWSSCCLNYDDQIPDGFYEVFGEFPEAVTSKGDFPVLAALRRVVPKTDARREVILLDSHSDPTLRSIIEEARTALESVSSTPDAHSIQSFRQLSLVVAGRLGGPQPQVRDLSAPALKHIQQLQTTFNSVVVPIGQIFIGSVRHRALLYKYLADIFGLKCRVMKGRYYANGEDDARVIVNVNNGEEYEMDLITRPGTSSPLEKRLALRASSREVAGTDVFSRASSTGGSTVANTAPESRSQSDAAHIDSIQAISAAADAALVAESTAQAPAQAEAVVPDPIATPNPLIEGNGSPPSLDDVPAATTLEQAMQMAAAAAMGQTFPAAYAGPAVGRADLPSPFASGPPKEPPIVPSSMPSNSGAGPNESSSPPPYENPAAQAWSGSGQPSAFGSYLTNQSTRSSAPYSYDAGEYSEPIRLSMGPNVGAGGANAAGGGDVQVEEMGPAALISDAAGQQYILQPVRASMDYSHLVPSMDRQSSLTNRLSGEPAGMATAHRAGSGNGTAIATASELSTSGSIPSTIQHMGSAEMSKQPSLAAGFGSNRSLEPLAENSPLDKLNANDGFQPQRYSQPVPHNYHHYQQQQYYHPQNSNLPDPGNSRSRSLELSGVLGSQTSLNGTTPDAAAMQWAAMQAADNNYGGPAGPFAFSAQQQQQQPRREYQYHNDSINLDDMGHGTSDTDLVSRLYLDSLRSNSVRMSVPIEVEARKALLSRPSMGANAADQNLQKRDSVKATSRSSGDGVPFPAPELREGDRQQSVNLYTPFGAIDGALTGSGSDTLSPNSSSGVISPQPGLRDKAMAASRASAAARAPSVAHSALPDLRDQNQSKTSARTSGRSSMLSGEGYMQSLDSRELDDGWEIDADELELGTRIDVGSYGEVYRGQWRQTDVAIKVFLDQDLGARMLSSFRKEVAIMKKLRHPNIVQFMGACSKPPNLCIVTQYVSRGSLFKLLHRSEGVLTVNMDERRRLQMALDVARGMNYLHTCRPPVIHRDLKSPNLLVDKDMTIKVCDFGLSRVRHATVLSAKSQAGTPEWTAPEILQGKPCNEASDVYSFGVILWELQTGEEPWTDKSAMQVVGAVAFANERLPIPQGIKPGLGDLMARCFGDPEERPSFSEIISILKRQVGAVVAAGSAAKTAAAAAARAATAAST